MTKIDDNTYINKLKKEIMDGRFSTKVELINFLKENRLMVLNDPSFKEELNSSLIELDENTLQNIEKQLLEFYDNKDSLEISSLNLEGVSSFEVDGKDYIKIEDDGDILVLDDSLEEDNFVEQFQNKQNELSSASSLDAEANKKEIIKDMEKEKVEVNLTSNLDVNIRDLTIEERRQFAAVMHMPDVEHINFVVDPTRNIYINKDNGDIYFVNKNQYGQLEVRKANEVKSETTIEQINIVDDNQNVITVNKETPLETDFNSLDDSDLQYIYETRFDSLTDEQKQSLINLLEQRKKIREQSLNNEKSNNKVFVKKIDNALRKEYNGFISLIFLCSLVALFGLGFLIMIFNKLNI